MLLGPQCSAWSEDTDITMDKDGLEEVVEEVMNQDSGNCGIGGLKEMQVFDSTFGGFLNVALCASGAQVR